MKNSKSYYTLFSLFSFFTGLVVLILYLFIYNSLDKCSLDKKRSFVSLSGMSGLAFYNEEYSMKDKTLSPSLISSSKSSYIYSSDIQKLR